jgi:hypothetical protein
MCNVGIIFTPNFVNQSVSLEVYMRRQTHTHTVQRFLILHFHLYGEEEVSKSIFSSVYGSIKSKYTVYIRGFRHRHKVRYDYKSRH